MKGEERVGYSILLDTYGSLLTEKQRDVFSLYVNDDYSVVEIADMTGMTRQAVSDTSRTVISRLIEYEDKLHMVSRNEKMMEKIDEILSYADDTRTREGLESIRKMLLEE